MLQESGLPRPINPQRIKSDPGDKSVNNASSDILLANQALFRRWTDQWEGGLGLASFLCGINGIIQKLRCSTNTNSKLDIYKALQW